MVSTLRLVPVSVKSIAGFQLGSIRRQIGYLKLETYAMTDRRIEQSYTERNEQANATSQALCEDAYKGFQGLDLGILKIGTQSCSFGVGIDLGIARGGASIGQRTGAGAEVGVPGARIGAGGGVVVDERGIKSGVAAAGELGPEIGTRVGVGSYLGDKGAGVHVGGDTQLGPASAGAYGKGYIDERGIHTRVGGHAELDGVAGGHTRVRTDLGEKTGVRLKHDGYVGNVDSRFDAGAKVDRKGFRSHIQTEIKAHGLY